MEEPLLDPGRLALDRALTDAVRHRLAAGQWPTPDTEAIALRGLLAEGLTPRDAAILRAVWGRLSAADGQPVSVWGAPAMLLAADRYGAMTRPVVSADSALEAARQGGRALLTLEASLWWGRLLAQPDLRVIAALPDDASARPTALLVSREPTGPTGEDRTFWVTDSPLSDARIVEALGTAGLAASLLAASGGLKLFMLAGYVQAEDGRLSDTPGDLTGVIGTAPVF